MTSRIDREGLNPRNIYYVFQGKTHDYESQGANYGLHKEIKMVAGIKVMKL